MLRDIIILQVRLECFKISLLQVEHNSDCRYDWLAYYHQPFESVSSFALF